MIINEKTNNHTHQGTTMLLTWPPSLKIISVCNFTNGNNGESYENNFSDVNPTCKFETLMIY